MVEQFFVKYIMLKSKIEEVLIYIVSSSNNQTTRLNFRARKINEITDYLVKPLNRDVTNILNSFFNKKKSSGVIKTSWDRALLAIFHLI
jgi:hypothetical protein